MNCHIFGLVFGFLGFGFFSFRVAVWFGSVGLERKLKNSPRMSLAKGCYLLMF